LRVYTHIYGLRVVPDNFKILPRDGSLFTYCLNVGIQYHTINKQYCLKYLPQIFFMDIRQPNTYVDYNN